ncbi:MAG: penicillin-binding transpeptidase domain-containing protein [bacterium]|nr:penicillin-binding transpeptidase domain-containing protein [bacterium]
MIHFRKIKLDRRKEVTSSHEIFPDEILLDASNLPEFDTTRFEGRLERPIKKKTLFSVFVLFVIVVLVFTGKLWILEVQKGAAYALKSENNRLRHEVIFAERGVVLDRNGINLIWNEPINESPYPKRSYVGKEGFGQLLGYVSYPKKDSAGFYYQDYFEGKDGVELLYNLELGGENGLKLTETNAKGGIESESTVKLPKQGERLKLSIDARLQEQMYLNIKNLATKVGFAGGAGVIMDVKTGELLALSSFPEYSPEAISNGDELVIQKLNNDSRKPFLNRAVSGVYTPGSIVKPFMALGVLTENLIDPNKKILSTGQIEVPNPYKPGEKSIFVDWKAHGWVDMRQAIAVSSNVYFYEVGGGFEGQKGLGITNIEKYLRIFGFGDLTGLDLSNEKEGTIPNPEWKAQNFNNDEWRLGDTYHTAIGQYGVQVTPIQVARAVASIGNNGKLLTPTVKAIGEKNLSEIKNQQLPISPSYFQIVREGMRLGVTNGIAVALNVGSVKVAAKTGTAELGTERKYVNSWVTGFFPYEKPRYSFVILMEKGPRTNTTGATYVMREMLDFMALNTPEYFLLGDRVKGEGTSPTGEGTGTPITAPIPSDTDVPEVAN